jgi:hypothetical protein
MMPFMSHLTIVFHHACKLGFEGIVSDRAARRIGSNRRTGMRSGEAGCWGRPGRVTRVAETLERKNSSCPSPCAV